MVSFIQFVRKAFIDSRGMYWNQKKLWKVIAVSKHNSYFIPMPVNLSGNVS